MGNPRLYQGQKPFLLHLLLLLLHQSPLKNFFFFRFSIITETPSHNRVGFSASSPSQHHHRRRHRSFLCLSFLPSQYWFWGKAIATTFSFSFFMFLFCLPLAFTALQMKLYKKKKNSLLTLWIPRILFQFFTLWFLFLPEILQVCNFAIMNIYLFSVLCSSFIFFLWVADLGFHLFDFEVYCYNLDMYPFLNE